MKPCADLKRARPFAFSPRDRGRYQSVRNFKPLVRQSGKTANMETIMNRKEFLEKLAALYPSTFFEYVEKNNTKQKIPKQAALDSYKTILNNNEDYSKLFKKILEEHTSALYAPTPAWISAKFKELKPKEFYKPPEYNPQPIPDGCKQLIEELRKKYKTRQIENLK